MMFNSINNDISNYNSIPLKRQQYMKQQINNTQMKYPPSFSSAQNLGYNPDRQSPYSKPKQSSQILQNNFYKQNYEVNSPFQENLKNSNVRSYTSEQYYPSSQSDKLSENSNKWSRNSASYFPTTPLFNQQQKYTPKYQSSNQMFTSSNAFKKHSQQRNVYNFDSFSNKSKSRIKEMNQKIDQTTKSILKNGLIHQKQIFVSSVLRPSSKIGGSRQKKQFQSPRNIIGNTMSRVSTDKKTYSSIDRKRQHTINNQLNFQKQIYRENKINPLQNNFQFSKPLSSQNRNYQRVQPDRMPAFTQNNINQPFYANLRSSQQINFRQKDDMIDFFDFQDKNVQPQIQQNSYRLPSTHRKDITFNFMNKDQLSPKQLIKRDQFPYLGQQKNVQQKPILYTSQSQQTFNKQKYSNFQNQQSQKNKNLPSEFEVKPYLDSRIERSRFSDSKNRTQFQATDLIVLKQNLPNQNRYQKMPSRSNLIFNRNESQDGKFIPMKNQQNFINNSQNHKQNIINSQSSRFSYKNEPNQNQQYLKRTSSFQGFNFSQFEKNEKKQNYDPKMNPQEQVQDFQFQDFEESNNNNSKYQKFIPKNTFKNEKSQFFDERYKKIVCEQSNNENKQIQNNKRYFKAETDRNSNNNDELFPTVRTIPAPKMNIVQNYLSNIKEKQSQVIAISLIALAVVILIIQLAS